ncbi:MAG: type II toxin-antitoxin system VapC family toxin [Candidatus Bathyarchaeia archaeon]
MDPPAQGPNPARRVYIDTMVFIYQLGPQTPLSEKARAFFRDVEGGKYIGVTSSFTVAELIAVYKELLCRARGTQIISPTDMLEIKRRMDVFLNKMGIVLYDADELATVLGKSTIFADCERILEEAMPIRGSRDGRIRVIGGADALHIAMAIRANAELFGTFDEGFKGSGSWLPPLLLSEAY